METSKDQQLTEHEKSFIDRMGWSAFITSLVLLVGMISSFSVSQYRISEQDKILSGQAVEITNMKREKETDGRSMVALQTEIKALNQSIGELKDQNKETYRLLLDISKR